MQPTLKIAGQNQPQQQLKQQIRQRIQQRTRKLKPRLQRLVNQAALAIKQRFY